MKTSNQLPPAEKQDQLESYKAHCKNSLIGIGIIIACFCILEMVIHEIPEIMLDKIVFKNGFTIMAGTLHQAVISIGILGIIVGVISAGYWYLRINDVSHEN